MMLKRALQNLRVPSESKRKRISSTVYDRTCAIDLCAEASGAHRKRKREQFSIIDKNVKLKKQQTAKDSNSVDKRVASMDYISQLPDTVIHIILSLLRSTKDAARTSILSKRWRDMWTSFSVLTFDQRTFQELEGVRSMENCNEVFKQFIDKSLQSHLDRKLGIYKFVLHVTSYDPALVHHMERWFGIATENNAKELGFHVHVNGTRRYILPKNVFAADGITGLRLQGCKLETCSIIKLPHLQKLYLRNLRVDQQIIMNLISSCPLIDDLRLIQCSGLSCLDISSLLKLDRVEVHCCNVLKKIDITAPSLQAFWYCGKKQVSCKINLKDCESLKRLTLEDSRMTNNQFHGRFFSFPLLEKLELSNCLKLTNIRIGSHRLNRLVLRGCKNLEEAEIDTPNLLSFEYQGDKFPFSFLNPKCLKEVKLSFAPMEDRKLKLNLKSEPLWFPKLREFLGKFDHKGLKLVVRSSKNVIIHEDFGEILLSTCGGLKIEMVQSSVGAEELLDISLHKGHPQTLSIMSSSSSEFPKLVHEKIINRKEDPTCCTSNNPNNKCWRHFLKDAKMVNLKAAKGKNDSESMAWLKSRPNANEIACFRLDWKSDKDGRKASR
ncbi:PREDICTED: putative FBD-associated F-box protein At5g22720 [Prunus mume]|uniref:FBD-associated F-box protein At5g22720 n=1 Tax=Prunus mume TaxID=102107 RepID=A0ABM0PUP5_PRUMU|nr:PREDICTED: putative FBD-associated F-box protein At5g22720 [Prunus mume]